MRLAVLAVFVAYALLLSFALGRRGFRARPAVPGTGPAPRPVHVLVVGATGRTGRLLVEQALARGYAVTAFVRNPSRLGIEHARLRVVRGDVLDPASVDDAVRGQDAVLCALGHARYLGPSRILSDGTRHIVRAMERQGVRRLVVQTSLGIGDSAGRLGLYYTLFVIPVVLPFYFWDKTRQERLTAASALDWTIVRPGVLTGGPGQGACRHGEDVGGFLGSVRIARTDVAAFVLDQLTDTTYRSRAPGLARRGGRSR